MRVVFSGRGVAAVETAVGRMREAIEDRAKHEVEVIGRAG